MVVSRIGPCPGPQPSCSARRLHLARTSPVHPAIMLLPLFYVLKRGSWPDPTGHSLRWGLFWVGLLFAAGMCTPLNPLHSVGVWCCSLVILHGGVHLLSSCYSCPAHFPSLAHPTGDNHVASAQASWVRDATWYGAAASLISGACCIGAWLSGDIWVCATLYGALATGIWGFFVAPVAPIRVSHVRQPWHKLRADRRYHALRCRGLILCLILCSPVGGVAQGAGQNRSRWTDQPDYWSGRDGQGSPTTPASLAQVHHDELTSLMQANAAHDAVRRAVIFPKVPQMRSAQGLQPIEECGARPLLLQEVCLPAYCRRVAVFHGELVEGTEPLIFQVDSRVFRPFLDTQIKQAVGLDAISADLLALVSAFPDLPPEQYVLRPTRLPWFLQQVPIRTVDPGVSFQVLQLARDGFCHDIIAAAARRLHLPVIPEAEMCTCLPGSFVADSQPLLHHQGILGSGPQCAVGKRQRAQGRAEHVGVRHDRGENIPAVPHPLPSKAFHHPGCGRAAVSQHRPTSCTW